MIRGPVVIASLLIACAAWVFLQNPNGSAAPEATGELARTERQADHGSESSLQSDSVWPASKPGLKSVTASASNLILMRSEISDPEIESWVEREIGPNSTDAHLIGKYNIVKLNEVVLAQIVTGDVDTFSFDSGALSSAPATITRLRKYSNGHYVFQGTTNVRGAPLEFWFAVQGLWRVRGQIPHEGDGGILAVRPIPNSDLHLLVEITGPMVHDH